MPIQVLMPQLGESVIEGTVSKWLKSVGDEIKEFEPLLEVNTDKVDSEIPSPATGTILAILVKEGNIVEAGSLLAWIGEAGESLPEDGGFAPQHMEMERDGLNEGIQIDDKFSIITPQAGRHEELGFISPVVAKISREKGIDLTQIKGTGEKSRITKKDLLNYLSQGQISGIIDDQTTLTNLAVQTPAKAGIPGEIVPHTIIRRRIADHMVKSKQVSPHVTTMMEADLKNVIAHRESNKSKFRQDGVNLTFTAYFVSATVTALKSYPIVNSSWLEDGIMIKKEINIGMATSLGEEGLIVPVIKDADRLSLLGLARTINDLANRARIHQLKPDEVRDGTFTITNHGISGSLIASPIINQPQAAILGVGAIQKRAVVIDDAIAIRPMVYLSLTFDHRLLDGAIADYFLGRVVESLQEWK